MIRIIVALIISIPALIAASVCRATDQPETNAKDTTVLAIESNSFVAPHPGQAIKVSTADKTTIGRLVEYTSQSVLVLRRDGRMVQIDRNKISRLQKLPAFQPYTSLQLQEHFRKLFGRRYEVTRTRHYVVVHPPGLAQQWAAPFEELYNRFFYYFSVRGFSQANPEFPMIVVVFGSRAEFNKVAARQGVGNPNSYAGYYSPQSNWVVTYQQQIPGQNSSGWEDNETLIHEAMHQYAFNHGIHKRWAPTPKWCAEGLASMFEAKGINNARSFKSQKDKLNKAYVSILKRSIDGGTLKGQLKRLVATDRIFQEDIGLAYSLSWGTAFFLAETQPAEFNAYLQRVAARKRTSLYTAADRIADFSQSFGSDFELLQSHFERYIGELK